MNLRVAHHGEDQEMDVVEDGPTTVRVARKSPTFTPAAMAASLLRALQRDPNPQGRWKKAILSEDGTELSIFTADGREFIATIREVS